MKIFKGILCRNCNLKTTVIDDLGMRLNNPAEQ